MNYQYVKDHKIPFVLEIETGFYVRVDFIGKSIGGFTKAVRNKNNYEVETSVEAYERIETWIKENHQELMI